VKSLSINEAGLSNFVLEVERCELVTWDGTILRFQGEALPSNARISPRSFEKALDPGGRPLGVYLGVKRLQWEEDNLNSHNVVVDRDSTAARHRRFSLQESDTPDLFTGNDQSSALQYLIHEVRILFEDEIAHSQDYELIKIAELLRATERQGTLLSNRYIPPCLSISASPVLMAMLREIRDVLTAKGHEFSEYKRQRTVQTLDMGSRNTAYLLFMQTVNRYIPLLHHHLEVEETHPCVLYALLRQLIGEFSTFSETVSVLGGPLPPYRHDRLWECFDAAIRVARELLTEPTKAPEYVIPLIFTEEYFGAELDKQFFEGNKQYYLAIKAEVPARELERLFLAGTAKVCSREDMGALRQRALHGLTVRYVETPPEELRRRINYSYFALDRPATLRRRIEPRQNLDHHTTLWLRIEQQQNIAVYCQLAPERTEMQLMAISET
jgi:type VI secretion system protein ImpJ